jgi:hypothetical protein
MSFVLPRNMPRLTFTGSVRALGQKRPKNAPPPLPSAAPRAREQARDVYVEDVPTPYIGSRPHMKAARPPLESYGDDVATLAMEREVFERAARRPSVRRGALPVFNMERAVAPVGPALIVTPNRRPRSSTAALMKVLWLMAAILAGMASFKYTPECVDGIKDAVQVLESR